MARIVVTFNGLNLFGSPAAAISASGVKVGDQIISVINTSLGTESKAIFSPFVFTDGEILQLASSGDESGNVYKALLHREATIA